MQFSRSLLAAVVMGSLLTVVPAKAVDTDTAKKIIIGSTLAGLFYLYKRQVDTTKTGVVSKTLNFGSSVTQKSIDFVKDNASTVGVLGLLGFVLYHNTKLPEAHATHTVTNFLQAKHVHASHHQHTPPVA